MSLPTRPLGSSVVSAVGLGCMNLSHAYGVPPGQEEGGRLLNRALDLGCSHLDTAALYGGGGSERLIGQAVMHRRREFKLASKCVLTMDGGRRVLDGSPAAVARTLDAALQRLGTDHIDLYYLHRLDPRIPIEESVGALVRAREAGKIGAIGVSEMGAATIRRAHAVHPIAAVQTEYSPISRNAEIAVLDLCRELGIAFVAFSPVARGLLAGAIRDGAYAAGDIRAGFPRYVEPQLSTNLALAGRFAELARKVGRTPAQLSIGWGLAKSPLIVSIPGTTSEQHLAENLAAASRPMAADIVAAVDALFPPGVLAGARYPAAAQAQVGTETFDGEELAGTSGTA